MITVLDVFKRIERVKKDLEYVRSFQDKWRDQRDRFPKIYEGIVAQEAAFVRELDDLRNLEVPVPQEVAALIQLDSDDASRAAGLAATLRGKEQPEARKRQRTSGERVVVELGRS